MVVTETCLDNLKNFIRNFEKEKRISRSRPMSVQGSHLEQKDRLKKNLGSILDRKVSGDTNSPTLTRKKSLLSNSSKTNVSIHKEEKLKQQLV